jgi:hypothetical protein
MTPRELLKKTAADFRTAGIPDPEVDASLLLSHVTGLAPLMLRLDADRVLTVPDAYAELYPLYIIMKTDLANGDIERYNNSAKSFKSSYDAYACYVNRTRELGDYNAITLL